MAILAAARFDISWETSCAFFRAGVKFRRWKIAEVGSVGGRKLILFREEATVLATGLFGGDGFVSSMFS